MAHAYGAQRVRSGEMLLNALREPVASHVYFVVRQDGRKSDLLVPSASHGCQHQVEVGVLDSFKAF